MGLRFLLGENAGGVERGYLKLEDLRRDIGFLYQVLQ
jgi:hypothetical protein